MLQFQGILIIHTLIKFNPDWLSQQPVLITQLRKIWTVHPMLEKGKKLDGSNNEHWREIKLLAKCLLSFVKHRLGEIDVLFQLLRVYTVRSIPSFHFLKKFLEDICKVRLLFLWLLVYKLTVNKDFLNFKKGFIYLIYFWSVFLFYTRLSVGRKWRHWLEAGWETRRKVFPSFFELQHKCLTW